MRAAQVTSLALCKHNKNDLLLVKLPRRVRHGRARSMFWRYNEVPKEALAVLEVRVTQRVHVCMQGGNLQAGEQDSARVCSATRCLAAFSGTVIVSATSIRGLTCTLYSLYSFD